MGSVFAKDYRNKNKDKNSITIVDTILGSEITFYGSEYIRNNKPKKKGKKNNGK